MVGKARRSRRRWSEEFKRRVVAEAAAPGMSAAAVARRYDLNANLLFNWKRRYGVSDGFLPVEIHEPGLPTPQIGENPLRSSDPEPATSNTISGTTFEVTLANGHQIAVKGVIDPETMSRLLRFLAEL